MCSFGRSRAVKVNARPVDLHSAILATMTRIKVYFDFVSPYSYLALTQLGDFAARHGVAWEPLPVFYAALLDGDVRALFLEAPPATQDAASQPDGRGPAIEMLNCLRITDLPYVAGLLYPTEIVVLGECPSTYDWTEALYRRLGPPGIFRRVTDLSSYAR